MIFYFEAHAKFNAENLNDACQKISEQFARMAQIDWHGSNPFNDGVFKNGRVALNAEIDLSTLTNDGLIANTEEAI